MTADEKSPLYAALEARLAELLERRAALDANRRALNAEINSAREELRAERRRQPHLPDQLPSTIERSRGRLLQIKQWIEAGDSTAAIGQRLSVSAARTRELMRQATALRLQSLPGSSPVYNYEEWTAAFEAQLLHLRPRLAEPLLGAISSVAWQRYGIGNTDPVENAIAWSASFDLPKSGVVRRRS